MNGLFGPKVDCESPEGTTREQRHSDRAAMCRFLLKSGSAGLAWNEPGLRRTPDADAAGSLRVEGYRRFCVPLRF